MSDLAAAGLAPAGIVGATGAGGGALIRACATDSIVHRSEALVVAGPPDGIAHASGATLSIWLAGRLDAPEDGVPTAPLRASLAAALSRLSAHRPAIVAELAGPHVLVLRDHASGEIWLMRDPRGSRSLHYTRLRDGTVFAEHLVDLLRVLPATPAPDRGSVVQWIATRSLPPGRSLFSGVRRLAAGERLQITADGSPVARGTRPRFRSPAPVTAAEASEIVGAATLAAIDRAVAGSHRPAVRLSGGLDSACVGAGLVRAAPGALALGTAFPGYPEVDEADLMAQSAAAIGLELISLPYEETSLISPIWSYARRWAVPAGSPNLAVFVPLWAQARARGVDRLLDGEGGDELYGTRSELIADQLRARSIARAWQLVSCLPHIGPAPRRRRRVKLTLTFGLRAALPASLHQAWETSDSARYLQRTGLIRRRDIPQLALGFTDRRWDRLDGPLWWRAGVRTLLGVPDLLDAGGQLARDAVDAGLQTAHPFLQDGRLLDTMLSLPPEIGFQGVRDRGPLRDAMHGRIAETVRGRYRKSFFNEVSARRLDGADGDALRRDLRQVGAPIREYVSSQGLAELLDETVPTGPARYPHATSLFRLGAVNAWLRTLEGVENA